MFTADGDIVWAHFLKDISPEAVESHTMIFEQRTTAHFPLPPQCIVVSSLSDNEENRRTAIYVFNPLNGKGLEKPVSTHSYDVLHVAELPFEGNGTIISGDGFSVIFISIV